MIKFSEIFESYYDDDEGEYGFKESSFDDLKIHFELLCSKHEYSLVKDKKTGINYITYTDNINDSYQQGYSYKSVDYDEDGGYTYYEFNDDTAELTEDGIALFTQEEVKNDRVTEDVEQFANGGVDEEVLRITKENQGLINTHFLDLIKEFFSEKYRK
jgi:hypothetical protein